MLIVIELLVKTSIGACANQSKCHYFLDLVFFQYLVSVLSLSFACLILLIYLLWYLVFNQFLIVSTQHGFIDQSTLNQI